MRASSERIPDRVHQPVSTGPTPVVSPLPALPQETTWQDVERLVRGDRLVRTLRVDEGTQVLRRGC